MIMNYDYGLIRIFGPSIFKVKIPENLLNHLNKFIDNTIEDKEKSKNLDVGKGLVGDVKQEFRLERGILHRRWFSKSILFKIPWICSLFPSTDDIQS